MNTAGLQENALAEQPTGLMLRCGGTRKRFGIKSACPENIIAPLVVFASSETLRAALPTGWSLALAGGKEPTVGPDNKLHAPGAFFDVLCPVCTEALLARLRAS